MSLDATQDDAPLTVECPRCGAAAGEACRTADRLVRAPHRRRKEAYLATLGRRVDDA